MTALEKVARAITEAYGASPRILYQPWDSLSEEQKALALSVADAAMEAIREPTGEMLEAAEDHKYGAPIDCYAVNVPALFTAMIEAALSDGSKTTKTG